MGLEHVGLTGEIISWPSWCKASTTGNGKFSSVKRKAWSVSSKSINPPTPAVSDECCQTIRQGAAPAQTIVTAVELSIVDGIALGPQDVAHVPIGDETAGAMMEGRIGL